MEIAKDGTTVSTITLYSTAPATNCTLNLFFQNATETDSGRYSCSTPKSLSSLLLNVSGNLQSTLMWYLLCKTGVFLMCSMSAVLKYSCKIR
ncbi:hypothetical protein NFI96_000605 [Prochilodus magdalenae]|nr:hypothetical protein NFI96_000605 [Prochilodus magdalenae]